MSQSNAISPSHGSFFRRKRTSHLQKSPTVHNDPAPHPDVPRPSVAQSTQSSPSEIVTPPDASKLGRSTSIKSPKSRLSEALGKGRSVSGSARQYPPSAFLAHSRGTDLSNEKDLPAIPSLSEHSPIGSPTSSATSPQASRRESTSRLPNTPFSSHGSVRDGMTRSLTFGHSASLHPEGGVQALRERIHGVASKRISTLAYLRQVHEGNVYWFTTLQFQRSDFDKLPYFEPRRLARRAHNYLILGYSLPFVLDPHADNVTQYLRAFNELMTEFESYHNLHSPDGNSSGSIGKSKFPQMFRRATFAGGGKSRRTSHTADIFAPSGLDGQDGKTSGAQSSFTSFTSDQDLLPGEEYTFLLTPFLPFEPDYFETFATLCEVLVDCYGKIINLVLGPDGIQPGIGDLFAKADGRVRKLLIAGLVHDFDEATKQGIKSELAGVNKVILGGLI